MPRQSRERSVGIDLMRIVGVAAVVFGHVYGAIPATHQWIHAWHVPLFFVLSGYFWRSSRAPGPRRTLGDEFRLRSRTLALPYISWFVVIAVLGRVGPTLSGNLDEPLLIELARGGNHATGLFGTFWFVSALFFTCLLYRIVDRLPWPAQAVIGAAGLAAGILYGPWLAATPLGIGQALPCLVFLMAGRVLRVVEPWLARPLLVGLAAIAVALIVIAAVPMADIDLKNGSWGAPVLGALLAVVISAGMILVGSRLRLPAAAGRAATALASVAIAVVLLHPYLIWIAYGWVAPKWILLLALVVPWTVALLLRRTPLSYPLLGLPQSRGRRRGRRAAGVGVGAPVAAARSAATGEVSPAPGRRSRAGRRAPAPPAR